MKKKIKIDMVNKEVSEGGTLSEQIETRKTYLQGLISSAREKLKSHSKIPFFRKHEERERRLVSLFENIPNTLEEFIRDLENIKKELSKEITKEEINELCQTNNELRQLRINLENLQGQRFQIEVVTQRK